MCGVAAQVDHLGSVSDELLGLANENIARQSRHVIDLGQNLEVVGAISLALCISLAVWRGRSRRSSGPSSTGRPRAFSRMAVRSPRQWPGRMTRSTPAGGVVKLTDWMVSVTGAMVPMQHIRASDGNGFLDAEGGRRRTRQSRPGQCLPCGMRGQARP